LVPSQSPNPEARVTAVGEFRHQDPVRGASAVVAKVTTATSCKDFGP